MPNYANSKIYKLYSFLGDEVYIGSTIQPLSNRLSRHKSKYLLWKDGKYHFVTCFDLFENFGISNVKIELVESFPCSTIEELRKREGQIIRDTEHCVNKCIAGRTSKEYYKDNREKKIEKSKQYAKNNSEIVSCPCGSNVKKYKLTEHKKTMKHISYMESISS